MSKRRQVKPRGVIIPALSYSDNHPFLSLQLPEAKKAFKTGH
jgi:hypothetical protein